MSAKSVNKVFNQLLVFVAALLVLLLSAVNIGSYQSPKKVLGAESQVNSDNKFWEEFLVKNPDYIFKGQAEELLAVSKLSARVYIVVAYKETKPAGFIITAYDTTNVRWLFKKELIWSKDS